MCTCVYMGKCMYMVVHPKEVTGMKKEKGLVLYSRSTYKRERPDLGPDPELVKVGDYFHKSNNGVCGFL